MPSKVKVSDTVRSNLDIIFDLMTEIGVESFVVNFDGGGDDGQVEESGEFKPASKKVLAAVGALARSPVEGARVSDGTRYSNGKAETMWRENPTMEDLIQSVCYDALETVAGGWEINEGSYGTFFFDVKKRKVNFDFNERVIESNLTQYNL